MNTFFLEGRINSDNVSEFETKLFASLSNSLDENSGSEIVLDAENLQYISSAGLRVLMKLRKRSGKTLKIVNASQEIYNIMEVTGFTELFDVKKKMREISVDGCEVIGSGGYGTVYRLDPETIVKIYRPEISLEFVENERNISQKAFLMGVPTAISYDVVKCGNSYGVVYEMLNAQTTAQIISKDPGKIPEISGKSAELLKTLHKIEPGSDSGLPDRKQEVSKLFDACAKFLSESEFEKVKAFINSIPDRKTFIHGDYNSKNIMLKDGEFQLIDIGSAAVGHPVFDIAGLMLSYIMLPNARGGRYTEEECRALLGFDFKYAPQVWEVMCGTYFGLSSKKEIEAMTKKLMPYCILMASYHGMLAFNTAEIVTDKVVRAQLLPMIENLQPLDF